jgi:hypothetical protein
MESEGIYQEQYNALVLRGESSGDCKVQRRRAEQGRAQPIAHAAGHIQDRAACVLRANKVIACA